MPVEIKKVLNLPISKGYINWKRLECKIHAALNAVDNNFNQVRDIKTGDKVDVNLEDAVIFEITAKGQQFAYKLIKPRFRDGKLVCSGYMLGNKVGGDIRWDLKTVRIF